MCDLYYNVLKENYGDDVKLVYMDTDRFLFDFKNFHVYKEMQNGAPEEHVDLSNFPTDHHLCSEENNSRLGLFESETR